MRDKLRQFMMGRYGMDQLNRFMLFVAVICMLIEVFFHIRVFYLVSMVMLILCYVRMLSRNYSARAHENQIYLKYERQAEQKIQWLKNYFVQAKKYHIYSCPTCGQKIRVPRGKGKISIHCPKCNHDFIKHS